MKDELPAILLPRLLDPQGSADVTATRRGDGRRYDCRMKPRSALLSVTALLLAAAALPAPAETYKWVDAKGQVNYSNAPPPESAKSGQVVEERISVMGMDPAVRAWAERRFAEQERAEALEWQRRQQALAVRPQYAVQPASGGYNDSYAYNDPYYPGYYGGTYYAGHFRASARQRLAHRVAAPRATHHASAPRVSHHSRGSHASRGSSRR
jgi:hypothetical protein